VTDAVDRYLTLGLRLGRHVDGLVDAYYGPLELAEAVAAEEIVAAADLAGEAQALLDALPGSELEPARQAWLAGQLRGLETYARVLAGETIGYADEVEACYGVRPTPGSEDAYRACHARLDELLPGTGSLVDRYNAWRAARAVPADRMVPGLCAVAAVLRTRTEALVELPAGERFDAEPVRDEPWWAFNYYRGDLASRVVVNTDPVATPFDLVILASHEVYPGHHTEHALKEQRLLRDAGRLEEGIQLVPTPQALVSEGIAELGLSMLLDDGLLEALAAALGSEGLEDDLRLGLEVDGARRAVRGIGVDAALMLHEHGASEEEAIAHVERWGLRTPKEAAQAVRFATDPTWRAYTITYSAGRRLCDAYVAGDPVRFRTLLTEQVTVDDLLAAA
jgi:hypothetical protein